MKINAEPTTEETIQMKTKYSTTLSAADAKSGDPAQNRSIRRQWSVLGLGGLLFTVLFALSPSPVKAECAQWDVSGDWRMKQNNGFTVRLSLSQDGKNITGTATHFQGGTHSARALSGNIEGEDFYVTIYWKSASGGPGPSGVYRGKVGSSGRLDGTTYDAAHPGSKATWFSSRAMTCADATAVEPTNPAPKPIEKSGKIPANPPPKPIKNSGKIPQTQSSAAAPTITARPILVTIPAGEFEGTVTLTWDGGPDHPDARPWFKESSQGEEVMVADQGKGTRRLPVERGKNYRFILKDSGQELARAVVISKQ